MKNKELRVLIFNPEIGVLEERIILAELKEYYKIIECDRIDIAVRKIGDRAYDFIIDDEGLLKENFKTSVGNDRGYFVGIVIICNNDGKGELISLTDEDIKHIKKKTYYFNVTDNHSILILR